MDVWILYWNYAGRCHPFDFDAIIHDALPATRFDAEALGFALDELMLEASG